MGHATSQQAQPDQIARWPPLPSVGDGRRWYGFGISRSNRLEEVHVTQKLRDRTLAIPKSCREVDMGRKVAWNVADVRKKVS